MTPQEQLCEKMRQEQNKYYDWLTAQPPEEILRHAYEYLSLIHIYKDYDGHHLPAKA